MVITNPNIKKSYTLHPSYQEFHCTQDPLGQAESRTTRTRSFLIIRFIHSFKIQPMDLLQAALVSQMESPAGQRIGSLDGADELGG